jgi:hypothetical protein
MTDSCTFRALPLNESMNCYLCGSKIPQASRQTRRRVQTGDRFVRRNGRISNRNFTFGMRVVCSACVRRMDRKRDADQLIRNLGAIGLLIFLAILLGFN